MDSMHFTRYATEPQQGLLGSDLIVLSVLGYAAHPSGHKAHSCRFPGSSRDPQSDRWRQSPPHFALKLLRSCVPPHSLRFSKQFPDPFLTLFLASSVSSEPQALAFGKDEEAVKKDLGEQASNVALLKSKVFEGNKPTNSILFQKLTPATLGKPRFTTFRAWTENTTRRLPDRYVRA